MSSSKNGFTYLFKTQEKYASRPFHAVTTATFFHFEGKDLEQSSRLESGGIEKLKKT